MKLKRNPGMRYYQNLIIKAGNKLGVPKTVINQAIKLFMNSKLRIVGDTMTPSVLEKTAAGALYRLLKHKRYQVTGDIVVKAFNSPNVKFGSDLSYYSVSKSDVAKYLPRRK
jgi:hypothetical protein